MAKRRVLESHIENYVRYYAKDKHGLIARKMNGTGFASWPDREFMKPGGRPFFIEFKAPGEKPTPGQEDNHRMLRGLGYTVYVVDDKAAGREIIDREMKSARRMV